MKLGELAVRIEATLDNADPETVIYGLGPIEEAGPREIAFVANEKYNALARDCRAAAVIARPGVVILGGVLRTTDPYAAFVRALDLFHEPLLPPLGIHPTASIASDVEIGSNPSIGAYAVIGEGVRIGANARIDARVVLYPGVVVGDDFVAFAGVVVREGVRIGSRVRLQPGAIIGADGFGYIPDPDQVVRGIPQTGSVVLEDDVEVGANATIDRATIGVTRLRQGAKIDNLVMIAHGCDIGAYSFVAAQSGLAGSSRVGAGAQLGGQVGVAGHLRIGEGSRVAAQAGVHGDVAPGATVGGTPSVDVRVWRRMVAGWVRLPEALRRLRRLEKLTEHLQPAKPSRRRAERGTERGIGR